MKNEKRKQSVSVEILGGPTKFLLRGDLTIKGGPMTPLGHHEFRTDRYDCNKCS